MTIDAYRFPRTRAGTCVAGLLVVAALLSHAGRAAAGPGAPASGQRAANADATTMAAFVERTKAYGELHRKVAGSLPTLARESSPGEIDTYQRALAAGIRAARANARPGDLLNPAMQSLVRSLLARLFRDRQAKGRLRESIMDDNPRGGVRLAVNARYPDVVPLSTMPPDVLKQLPALPQELEYRFVGDTLILLDPDAHIVVDYLARALPR